MKTHKKKRVKFHRSNFVQLFISDFFFIIFLVYNLCVTHFLGYFSMIFWYIHKCWCCIRQDNYTQVCMYLRIVDKFVSVLVVTKKKKIIENNRKTVRVQYVLFVCMSVWDVVAISVLCTSSMWYSSYNESFFFFVQKNKALLIWPKAK